MKDKTEDEIEMMKIMGFGSFDTTKVFYFLFRLESLISTIPLGGTSFPKMVKGLFTSFYF